jgi:hypothetical protein
VSGARNSVNYRTDGVPIDEHVFDQWRATPAERDKYRYEFQNLPYDQRNTAVFEAIHKDRRANKTARYKEIVDGSFNKDQSPSYMPLEDNPIDDPSFNGEDTPVSVDPQENSYKDTKERQEVLSTAQTQDKGLDMSDMPGFDGALTPSKSLMNRVPAHLRGSGSYEPSPVKPREVNINDMFSGGPDTSYKGFKSPSTSLDISPEYQSTSALKTPGAQYVVQEVTKPEKPVASPPKAPQAPQTNTQPKPATSNVQSSGFVRFKDAMEDNSYTKEEVSPGIYSMRIG